MQKIYITISIMIIQLIIIFSLYKFHKNILYPSVFFQVYYSMHIILGLLVFNDHNYSYLGIFWLMGAMFSFSIGGILVSGYSRKKKITSVENKNLIIEKKSVKILIVSIVIGSLFFLELLLRNGLSLNMILNFDSLLSINNEMAVKRYTGGGSGVSKISRVFLVFTYFSPLIGGFNYNFYNKTKLKILCLMGILPSFLIVIVQNTKSTWIAGVFLFLSGYITSLVYVNKALPKISFKKLKYAILSIMTFLIINYLSMMFRLGRFDFELIGILNKKFTIYALGHIPAFDIWFTKNIATIEYNWGIKTFYGVADFLGILERTKGIYTDFVSGSFGSTNIFMAFRPYLEDFGPFIGLIMMVFLGFSMTVSFKNVQSKRDGIVLLSGFYFYILYGFITSAWAYMSYLLVFILFWFYVRSIGIR